MKILRVLFLVACVAAVLALQGPAVHAQVDHFKVYEVFPVAIPPPTPMIQVKDQFGTMNLVPQLQLSLKRFLLPVVKSPPGEPIIHPMNHLTWYEFKTTAPQRKLLVSNQFGNDQAWTIGDQCALLVPAQKIAVNGFPTGLPPPVGLDHYNCYVAKSGPLVNQQRVLTDQFHVENVTVLNAAVFCNPADKLIPDDGVGTFYPDIHLACYTISEQLPLNWMVTAADQFMLAGPGPTTFEVQKGVYLCVPSTKKIAPACSGE